MAKSTGLAWTTMQVADAAGTLRDIRNDSTDLQFSTPRAVQDVTGLDKSANERLLLLADFSCTINGVFNPAANQEHAVFSTVPSTSVNRAVNITTNGKNLNLTGVIFTDYQIIRAATGELTYSAPGQLGDGAVPAWSLAFYFGRFQVWQLPRYDPGSQNAATPTACTAQKECASSATTRNTTRSASGKTRVNMRRTTANRRTGRSGWRNATRIGLTTHMACVPPATAAGSPNTSSRRTATPTRPMRRTASAPRATARTATTRTPRRRGDRLGSRGLVSASVSVTRWSRRTAASAIARAARRLIRRSSRWSTSTGMAGSTGNSRAAMFIPTCASGAGLGMVTPCSAGIATP